MDLGAVFLILEHMLYNTCDRKPLLPLVIGREPWPIRCCFPMRGAPFPVGLLRREQGSVGGKPGAVDHAGGCTYRLWCNEILPREQTSEPITAHWGSM